MKLPVLESFEVNKDGTLTVTSIEEWGNMSPENVFIITIRQTTVRFGVNPEIYKAEKQSQRDNGQQKILSGAEESASADKMLIEIDKNNISL